MARKLNVIEIFEFQKRSYFVFEKKGKLKRARCCYKCALEPGRGICTPQTTHGKLIPFKWTSVRTPHGKKTGIRLSFLKTGEYNMVWSGEGI